VKGSDDEMERKREKKAGSRMSNKDNAAKYPGQRCPHRREEGL
jgi:hypothetical protein